MFPGSNQTEARRSDWVGEGMDPAGSYGAAGGGLGGARCQPAGTGFE